MTETPTRFEFEPTTMQDPHAGYARLRAELPVHQTVMPPGLNVWLVTRYDDVRAALADPRLSKDVEQARELLQRQATLRASGAAHAQTLSKHMLNADPPDHTRLRRLMTKAFTPARVARLRPRVEELANQLLDKLSLADEAELISQFGFPLPLAVICELFGVPEADRADLHRWSTAMVTDSASVALTSDSRSTDAQQAAAAISGYLVRLIESKRRQPGDDLLTALVQARGEHGEDMLDANELVSMAFLTLVAGHETVVNLIGNGMLALLRHPEQLAALRADPALLPNAIEEFLRFDGPANSAMLRHTTEPVTFGDVTIPAGEFVLALVTSANRDGDRFADPDRFDISRPAGGHLTFGHGIHYCIGAPLARLEGEVAFRLLLDRFPHIRLGVPADRLRWRFSTLVRGLESLPVRLDEPVPAVGGLRG
jgi:cytochrome P450